jgi:hypothetical protein
MFPFLDKAISSMSDCIKMTFKYDFNIRPWRDAFFSLDIKKRRPVGENIEIYNTWALFITAKAAKKAQRKPLCPLVDLAVNMLRFSSPLRHKATQNIVRRFQAVQR